MPLKVLESADRETARQRFMARSSLEWDIVSVGIFGQVTALVRDDDSRLIAPGATFEARKAFWTTVLRRLTPKEVKCADLGCRDRRLNAATLEAGDILLFWQLNHATKATLTQRRPSLLPTNAPMSDEALTKASKLDIPTQIRAPFGVRECPRCNEEVVMVDTNVTGLRWIRGELIVMSAAGELHARKFAWPLITMSPVPASTGSGQPWANHLFQDARFSSRRFDAVSGEDLSHLVCRQNSAHPALACAASEETYRVLSALLLVSTDWVRQEAGEAVPKN